MNIHATIFFRCTFLILIYSFYWFNDYLKVAQLELFTYGIGTLVRKSSTSLFLNTQDPLTRFSPRKNFLSQTKQYVSNYFCDFLYATL